MSTVNTDTGEIIDDDPDVIPFAMFLQDHQRGRLHAQLTDRMNELVRAVRDVDSKGSLTLKIDVKPEAQGQVSVRADVKLSKPLPGLAPSIYYLDDDANLRRDDPNQQTLPLYEVPRPNAKEA